MEWELRHVEDVEAIMDDSGVYVIIHRVETTETHKGYSGIRVTVRADLMNSNAEARNMEAPIMSFSGSANAVRKALLRFIDKQFKGWGTMFSHEHASYIGYELLRAELTPNYQQD